VENVEEGSYTRERGEVNEPKLVKKLPVRKGKPSFSISTAQQEKEENNSTIHKRKRARPTQAEKLMEKKNKVSKSKPFPLTPTEKKKKRAYFPHHRNLEKLITQKEGGGRNERRGKRETTTSKKSSVLSWHPRLNRPNH